MKLFFSSTASSGSRIVLDGATVLDKWEECCTMFTSDLVTVGEGYHILNYEYRSAPDQEASPTNSYAVLAYSTDGGTSAFGNASDTDGRPNAIEPAAHPLYADVAWLACAPGSSTLTGHAVQAGFAQATSDLTTTVDFGNRFTAAPLVFAGLVSTGTLSGHPRLLAASERRISLATEYDTCNFIVGAADRMISWVVIPTADGDTVKAAVAQRPTNTSDVAALLQIRELLSLPDYLQWRNGSDPCCDRWAGIECRTIRGTPRVVVLDVRFVAYLPEF
jgi:hypothetical protein